MRKKIIRLENSEGRGVYRVCYGWVDFFTSELCKERHLTFFEDETLFDNFKQKFRHIDFQDFLFGFSSFEQMERWIPSELTEKVFAYLEKRGVRCAIYEGEVIEGKAQALINSVNYLFVRTVSFSAVAKMLEKRARQREEMN